MFEFLAQLVTCGVGTGKPCTICDIWVLTKNVVDFILGTLAVPIVIVALIIGGFMYLTSSGDPKKTEQAKKVVTSAIIGLVIALAAFLIVDTILVTLVKKELLPPWTTINTQSCPAILPPEEVDLSKLPRPGIVITPGTYTDAEARRLLDLAGIPIHSSENCSDPTNPRCTSLEGIPKSAINYLLELDRRCNAQNLTCGRFVLTGGTETGHETHGSNTSRVDIAPLNPPTESAQNAQRYRTLRDLAKATGALPDKTFCEKPDGSSSLTCVGADHIHVEFPR